MAEDETRAMMLLRANVLASGILGHTARLVDLLMGMLNAGLYAAVPEQGSVGASGDLAPLSHLALTLIGEGELIRGSERGTAATMLRAAGLAPVSARPQGRRRAGQWDAGAHGDRGPRPADALTLWETAHVAGAATLEALLGTPVAFDAAFHAARGQARADSVQPRCCCALLEGSQIRESHRHNDPRVQDAYALRCMPQVHGPVGDAIQFVRGMVAAELNAATDNPLVFDDGTMLSGGNFHGQAVAMAADVLAIALTNLAVIAERRIDRLVHPDLNQGLPPFLTTDAGVSSGYMMAQVTAAALASECKVLAHPASVDSIPTDGGKEDVVPMAMGAAIEAAPHRTQRATCARHRIAVRRTGNRFSQAAAGGSGSGARRTAMCARWCRCWSATGRTSPDIAAVAAAIMSRPLHRAGRVRWTSRAWPPGDTHRTRERREERRQMTTTASRETEPVHGPRVVRAPRGSDLTCRAWPQEAALRMLMNNLDPEVAERPDDLVVYGGTGRAARSWEAFDAIVRSLRSLANDETLLVQSGKPVGIFRTHPGAPRVLIANSNLVGRWATWDVFRELERKGLTMYGQMTAGSWIYIGSQGIIQGTYETFGAVARQHFGGSLAGRFVLTAGLGGMGGAQPLAATHVRRRDPRRRGGRGARSTSGSPPATAIGRRTRSMRRSRGFARRSRSAVRCQWHSWGTPRTSCPSWYAAGSRPDVLTDQTSAHDTLNGYVPNGMTLDGGC